MKQPQESLSDWSQESADYLTPTPENNPKTELLTIEGRVDSLTRWGATGWAWLTSAPTLALTIEAVLNERVIGMGHADQPRADLVARGKGTGHCSFSLIFSEAIEGELSPTIFAVGPTGRTILPGSKWSRVAGHVDRLTRSNAMGWTWMPSEPDRCLQVEAVAGGKVIGHATADEMRADLAASGRGTGRYGFNVKFNETIADEELPAIRVLGGGDPTILNGPERLAAFEGVLEGITRWGATGWAWMPEAPYESVHVEAVIDGKIVGTTVADELRPDLVKRAQGTGRYGFTLAFQGQLTGDTLPTIRVLGPQGGTILPGETWSSVSGFIDRVSRSGASGWAWMPSQPQQSLRVDAVIDGTIFASVIADRLREDIAASGRGTGKYGFSLVFDEPLQNRKVPEFHVSVDGSVFVLPSASFAEELIVNSASTVLASSKADGPTETPHEAYLNAALASALLDGETQTELRRLSHLWNLIASNTSETAYDIGRAFQLCGCFDEAEAWYRAALAFDLVNPWAHYELSEIFDRSGRIEESANHMLAFFALVAALPKFAALDERRQTTILHRCHKIFGTNVALARDTYRAAYSSGVSDYLSILRVIEGALDHGSIEDAQLFMKALQERFRLDAYGYLAMSRLLEVQGDSDGAVSALAEAGALIPDNAWLRAQICFRLIELNRFVEADAAVALFAKDPLLEVETVNRRLPALQFRSAVRQKQADVVLALLLDYDFQWSDIEPWSYAEAIYTFARFGSVWNESETRLLSLLKNHLWTLFTTSESACLAVIHFHTAQSEWKKADELIESVSTLPVYQCRDMVIRRFEVACQLQKLDVAQLIYSSLWQGNPTLNLSESVLAMRFFAELKNWQRAADIAADVLRRGMTLPDDFYGLLQIIRRADLHNNFIALLTALNRSDPYAVQLKQILVDDLCVAQGVSELASESTGDPLTLSTRNSVLVKPTTGTSVDSARLAALVCTDRAYFFSVMTLFASIAPKIGKIADWYVFLSDDVPIHWHGLMMHFCDRLSIAITIVPESAFFMRNDGCPTDYGLFSGGRNLARSAYFRIYAANWLLGTRRYRKAVYMDSDIICQGDLRPLFDHELDTASLAGRPEDISAAVIRAAGKCGVGAENYINSGVLVFNFEHPKIPDQLHDAIWQSENAGARLTFHDQCALNISFAGSIKHLPERFNTFLRPFKVHDKELSSGVLLHYLDRPKPWDSTFRGSHREPWILAATVVKAIVPADFYHEVTSASMGRVPVASTINSMVTE